MVTKITELAQRIHTGDGAARDAFFTAAYEEMKRLAHSPARLMLSLILNTLYHWAAERETAEAAQVAERTVQYDWEKACLILREAWERGLTASQTAHRTADEKTVVKVEVTPDELEEADERLVQVLEERYFGGYIEPAIAETLQVTERTVQYDWEKVRLILREAQETELTASQMARMSRLLDEALPLDRAGRLRWIEALAPQNQDLVAALTGVLLPEEGGGEPLTTLSKVEWDDALVRRLKERTVRRDLGKKVRWATDLLRRENLARQHWATKRARQRADNALRVAEEAYRALWRARQEAENALRAAEEAKLIAEKADRAKTRFLAAATHDLRQPMHAIGLLVSLVREQALDPRLHALFDRISDLVERMERLFNALLDLSKFDAGAVQVNVSDIVLNSLLEEIELSAAPLATANGLTLRVHRCRAVVRSDPVLLNRMLHNLVENAIRYTERGRVVVGARRGHGAVRMQVLDTGPGIAEKDQQRIFEEFVRCDAGVRAGSQGLGLGLSIVQRSAQLLNHRVSLRSRPGRGSCFEIEVPEGDARWERTGFEEVSDPEDESLAGVFVALVEDDPQSLEAMTLQLKQWGCHVAAAGSASALLKELNDHLRSPDAIISDYRLEGVPAGLQVVAELREAVNESLPAMVITGEAGAEDLALLRQSGLPIMFKPVTPTALRHQLVALLAPP
jgi:signal transduction histidine kinase/CheY-like chemotaxis protein